MHFWNIHIGNTNLGKYIHEIMCLGRKFAIAGDETSLNKKDRWDSGKTRRQQIPSHHIQIECNISLHTFIIHKTVIRPLGLLFHHLDIFLLSLTIGAKFWTPQFYPWT